LLIKIEAGEVMLKVTKIMSETPLTGKEYAETIKTQILAVRDSGATNYLRENSRL
jgi:hypothetical protein